MKSKQTKEAHAAFTGVNGKGEGKGKEKGNSKGVPLLSEAQVEAMKTLPNERTGFILKANAVLAVNARTLTIRRSVLRLRDKEAVGRPKAKAKPTRWRGGRRPHAGRPQVVAASRRWPQAVIG